MTSPSGFTNTLVAQADHGPQATPATVETFALGECQFDARVTEISLIPSGALTADGTNNRTFTVINRGQTGAGTTVLGTLVTNIAGGNWTANDEKLLTLSATATDLDVTAGDVLACNETVGGTGVAHPAIQVVVRGTRK